MGLNCAGENLLVEGVSEGLPEVWPPPCALAPLRTQPPQCSDFLPRRWGLPICALGLATCCFSTCHLEPSLSQAWAVSGDSFSGDIGLRLPCSLTEGLTSASRDRRSAAGMGLS